MTSTIAWEYEGENADDEWFNISLGDADQLDNGDILITAGNGVQNQSPGRFLEVTPSGEKVWQMWMSSNMGSFAADRMPALAEPIN